MSKKKRRGSRPGKAKYVLAALCVLMALVIGLAAASIMESHMSVPVADAGKQLTAYQSGRNTAQYYVGNQWVWEKDLDTLLIIGIDDYGVITGSDSYNNSSQSDFLVLLVTDPETRKTQAIHINRDTMAEIPILGVNGQQAGTRRAQLALAYTYGTGKDDSCRNTVQAVSNLMYGIQIDHYITVTMDAVPIMNDWAGGVTLEMLDNFIMGDVVRPQGETVKLTGREALQYVRSRKDQEDTSNLRRMERQRQYASAWLEQSKTKFDQPESAMELVLKLDGYYYSDCTANELALMMDNLTDSPLEHMIQLEGESVKGENHMEYYVDDAAQEKLVVDMFYEPTGP